MKTIAMLAATTAILAGCSMVRSTPIGDSVDAPLRAHMSYNLPRLYLEIPVLRNAAGGHTIGAVKPSYIADPDHVYAMQYTSNVLYDEKLEVKVDPKTGFVTVLDGEATDRTIDIAAKIMEGIQLVKPGFFAEPGEQKGDKNDDVTGTTVVETLFIDPHRELAARPNGEPSALNGHLLANYGFRLDCEGCRPAAPRTTAAQPAQEGVFYRPFHTVILRHFDAAGRSIGAYPLRSPNGSRLAYMPLERGFAVARTSGYKEFADGAPVHFSENRPSEALAAVTGTVGLIGAVVAAPVVAMQESLAPDPVAAPAGEAEKAALIVSDAIERNTAALAAQAKALGEETLETNRNPTTGKPQTDGLLGGITAPCADPATGCPK